MVRKGINLSVGNFKMNLPSILIPKSNLETTSDNISASLIANANNPQNSEYEMANFSPYEMANNIMKNNANFTRGMNAESLKFDHAADRAMEYQANIMSKHSKK